jgi:hypothetical protein
LAIGSFGADVGYAKTIIDPGNLGCCLGLVTPSKSLFVESRKDSQDPRTDGKIVIKNERLLLSFASLSVPKQRDHW